MPELPEELRNRPPRAAGQEPTATLTLDAYLRIKAELEELTTHGRERITEKIKVAREHGDLKENAEYHAAKEEQGLMESKIRKLQHMLRDPEIVEVAADADEVGPGMLVTIRPARRGRPRRRDLPARRARRGEGARVRAPSRRRRRSAPRCSAPTSSRRSPTRRPPAPCGTWSWASSRSRGDRGAESGWTSGPASAPDGPSAKRRGCATCPPRARARARPAARCSACSPGPTARSWRS